MFATAFALGLGDPAPPVEVDTWLRGSVEDHPLPGRVWVLEFWAAWCGPCADSWPHLSALAEAHPEATFVAITADADESLPLLEHYLERQGDAVRIPVAHDKSGQTAKAYLAGLGQTAIPLSVIVDEHGNVAWAGHPGLLEVPLAMMLGKAVPELPETTTPRRPRRGLPIPNPTEDWSNTPIRPQRVQVWAFTIAECPECSDEREMLETLARRYAATTQITLRVSGPDDTRADAERLAQREHGLRVAWESAGDELTRWAPLLVGAGGPAAVVADRNGKLVWVGPMQQLDAVLERVVAGTHGFSQGRRVEDFESAWSESALAGDWETVLALLDGIAVETENPDAWLVLRRQALEGLGRVSEAELATLALLEVTTNPTRVLDEGSRVLGAGADSTLLDAVRRAAARLPPDWQLLFLRARAERALGELDQACRSLDQARSAAPEEERRALGARLKQWRREARRK